MDHGQHHNRKSSNRSGDANVATDETPTTMFAQQRDNDQQQHRAATTTAKQDRETLVIDTAMREKTLFNKTVQLKKFERALDEISTEINHLSTGQKSALDYIQPMLMVDPVFPASLSVPHPLQQQQQETTAAESKLPSSQFRVEQRRGSVLETIDSVPLEAVAEAGEEEEEEEEEVSSPSSARRASTSRRSTSTKAPGLLQLRVKMEEDALLMQEESLRAQMDDMIKHGKWTVLERRKAEPSRNKTHWDFLLQEMDWLAKDFKEEREWKRQQAKRHARSVFRWHVAQAKKEERRQKEEEMQLRKAAGQIARMVRREFWSKIEKIVMLKRQNRIEQTKQKFLEEKRDLIVEQTEKFSRMLSKELGSVDTPTTPETIVSSSIRKDEQKRSAEDDLNVKATDGSTDSTAAGETFSWDNEASEEDEESDLENMMNEHMSMLKEESTKEEDEVDLLAKDAELSIEELRAKYGLGTGASSTFTSSHFLLEDATMYDEDDDTMESISSTASDESEDVASRPKKIRPEEQHKPQSGDQQSKITEVSGLAQTFQPTGFTYDTANVNLQIPFLLNPDLKLREYQHIGLQWLVTMHDRNLNGILADEMGLGKTIQTIALLAHLACEKHIWGPHLVVVPTSVLLNWEIEFKRWLPGFKILSYYGTQKERKLKRTGWNKPNSFHVCITSYKLVLQDQHILRRKKWHYLILDEAHHIKNFRSQSWQTLLTFNSHSRLLLTGTPLQNSIMELWSLMHFLMPQVFASHSEFKEWFNNPLLGMVEGKTQVNEDLVSRLHTILRPFILRRLKKDVEKQLPKKFEHVVKVRLSKRQRQLYEDFMSRADTRATLISGSVFKIINVLMQLRKVCNHPDLFEPRPIVSSFQSATLTQKVPSKVFNMFSVQNADEALEYADINFLGLNFLMNELIRPVSMIEAQEVLPQSQIPRKLIEEISESERARFRQRATTGSNTIQGNDNKLDDDCIMRFAGKLQARRMQYLDQKLRHWTYINELKCRPSLIYGQRLIRSLEQLHLEAQRNTLEILTRPHRNSQWSSEDVHMDHNEMDSSPSLPVLSVNMRQYLYVEELPPLVVDSCSKRCEMMTDMIENFICIIPKVRSPPPMLHVYHPHPSTIHGQQIQEQRFVSTCSPRLTPFRKPFVRTQMYFPDKRLIQYDCGKLQTLAVLLRDLKARGDRVLIFTQMSKMLDIIEVFMSLHGYTYFRLDGTTNIEKRQYMMERYNTDDKIFAFILSTRSGGVGINLTGANTVIFYDSDWNPAMDMQAQDRCHRIGQTRDVNIYRLISESTIEERILLKANQKRMMNNVVIQSAGFTPEFLSSKLNIKELFGESEQNVISASELMEPAAAAAAAAEYDDEDNRNLSQKDVERMLASVEDESDVIALKNANQEAMTVDQEFEDLETDEDSEIEVEGINSYGIAFVEQNMEEDIQQELEQVEEIERAKTRNWKLELNELQKRRMEDTMGEEEETMDSDDSDDVGVQIHTRGRRAANGSPGNRGGQKRKLEDANSDSDNDARRRSKSTRIAANGHLSSCTSSAHKVHGNDDDDNDIIVIKEDDCSDSIPQLSHRDRKRKR